MDFYNIHYAEKSPYGYKISSLERTGGCRRFDISAAQVSSFLHVSDHLGKILVKKFKIYSKELPL